MGLRFFADHCVSNAIISTLRDAGHEVLRLRDHIPVESPDPVVIAEEVTWSVDSSQVQQTYVATEEVLRWLSATL